MVAEQMAESSGNHQEGSLRRPRRVGRNARQHRGRLWKVFRIVGDLLLWLAAVGGALCIALVIAAQLLNVSLIMFKTGSMSPTIPAGSVALVREIPAGEISVGDIVTVDRPGELPVTHRVISTENLGSGEWRIRMQGDANAQPDAATYDVGRVRQTLGHIPGLAPLIVSLGSPWVLGSLTLGATTLVMVTLWPRRKGRRVAE